MESVIRISFRVQSLGSRVIGFRVQGLRVQSLGFKACRTKSSEVWDAAPKAATHIVPCRQGSTAQVISASILDGIIYMHIYIHTYIL